MSAGRIDVNCSTKVLLCFLFPCVVIDLAAAQGALGCVNSTMVASVVDPHGMPIIGLRAADFRVSSRRDRATVASSQYRENQGRVVVLFDNSGSMAGRAFSNKRKVAGSVASEFVALAPAQMQVSLLSFASSIDTRFGGANGRKMIQEWLDNPPTENRKTKEVQTALYDAILESLHELSPYQPGDSIYVITDAGDNRSKASFSQLERAMLGSGVRLYVFLLTDFASNQGDQGGKYNMEGLARRTGGFLVGMQAHEFMIVTNEHFVYNDEVVKAIQNTTRQILNQMSSFYVLSVSEQAPSAKAKDWSLEVIDADGHKRKDIGLAFSHSLTSCSQQGSQVQ